ncbi:MAG TPA: hypothetical protein VJP86_00820 [Vicinamibacterales bacterium]|jgi:hypothetical protein|nr:hypothetical protein [Vicinamibacterales bacterium]
MALHKLALRTGSLALLVLTLNAAPASADVRVSIHDGVVTIAAKDATLRQILAEWARVGQTRFVDVERLTGGPMSIELTNVPERQALDILLRSITGYMLVPRPTVIANASQFDRILVIPGAAQPRSQVAASSAPAPIVQTRFQLPPATQAPEDSFPGAPPMGAGFDGSRQPLVTPAGGPPMPGSMDATRTMPGPAPATNTPVMPFGASTPGVVVQPPQQSQPGQPQPPGPPGLPGR